MKRFMLSSTQNIHRGPLSPFAGMYPAIQTYAPATPCSIVLPLNLSSTTDLKSAVADVTEA